MELREVTLPSGRKMEVISAPFPEAKKLYQAIASELKRLDINMSDDIDVNFIKNVMCSCIDSQGVEAALEACIKRCTYEGKKITASTFDPVEAREDYMDICFEVGKENVSPFLKGLFAQFKGLSKGVASVLP